MKNKINMKINIKKAICRILKHKLLINKAIHHNNKGLLKQGHLMI